MLRLAGSPSETKCPGGQPRITLAAGLLAHSLCRHLSQGRVARMAEFLAQ